MEDIDIAIIVLTIITIGLVAATAVVLSQPPTKHVGTLEYEGYFTKDCLGFFGSLEYVHFFSIHDIDSEAIYTFNDGDISFNQQIGDDDMVYYYLNAIGGIVRVEGYP